MNPYEKFAQLKKVIAGYNAKGVFVQPDDGAANASLDNARQAATG